MRKISIIISISLLVIISCKKKDDTINAHTIIHTNYPTLTWIYDTIINQHLKEDYLFNKGSYWIYKDSITDTIDTCMVDTVIFEQNYIFGINCVIIVKYATSHKNYKFFNDYYLMGNTFLLNPGNIMDSVQNNGVFYLNFKNTFYPFYSIDTMTYSDVYKLFYKNCNYSYLPDSGYYYLKAGIGIIKSEYYKNGQKSVYELKQYHIN
jgi:hypothetical protein